MARPLALVTGASSGIGLALAKELVERGHDVAAVADEPLPAELATVLSVDADLTDPAAVEDLAAQVRAIGRPLDVVVLNAGIGTNGAFVDTPVADSLRVVDLNVRSAVHLAGLLLPDMVRRGEGGVLITSSIAATMPGPYQATYNASKAFLHLFAQALHHELADTAVKVTALMPGPTDTDFFREAGMEDTRLGQMKKDDPADVAKDGLDALFAGKDHVIAGAVKNKAQVAATTLLPDTAVAAIHSKLTEPGSGD